MSALSFLSFINLSDLLVGLVFVTRAPSPVRYLATGPSSESGLEPDRNFMVVGGCSSGNDGAK